MSIQLSPRLTAVESQLAPLIAQIHQHPVFTIVNSILRLQQFVEIHVYAVYDFMCLIKALQRTLVGCQRLWLPPDHSMAAHLIHGLVLEEESDHYADDAGSLRYSSHFEWYVSAMQQCGANTQSITCFIQAIRDSFTESHLFTQAYIPLAAQQFITDTFTVIDQPAHAIAASFAFAREQITSGMFTRMISALAQIEDRARLTQFLGYCQRHIELDSDQHSTQSKQLVAELCGEDANKWQTVEQTALFSLQSRVRLLDGIYAAIQAVE